MKTIEELITIRDEYIAERVQNLDNIDFVSILKENGLTTETFAYQVAVYYLKHFNPDVIDVSGMTAQEAQAFDMEAVTDQHTVITYGSTVGKQVWYSSEDAYNKEYCNQNGIITACFPYIGGVICTTPSDLEVFYCIKNPPSSLNKVILDKLVSWIQSGTELPVTLDNNDILINNRKVFGIAGFQKNGMTVYVFHVSFNIDLDMINKVCLKPIIKVPAALSDYISYNKDDLIKEILSWLS